MSILAALRKRWNFSVESPGSGRVVYREGNREYTFPVYEADGELVLVGVPSAQRIYFFFNWYWHPRESADALRERILPRIAEHLGATGLPVRVLTRNDENRPELQFHPELFECRGRASELLADAGYDWFQAYGSIELTHEEYGLEISGIRDERHVAPILAALQRGFPHWHHTHASLQEDGWLASITMFPSEPCASGSPEEG